MKSAQIARHLDVDVEVVERLLTLSGAEMLKDKGYINYLKKLDLHALEHTLPEARAAYERGLPAFQQEIQNRYGVASSPMSAYTLGNWVVGALQYPENTDQILHMHRRIPSEVIINGLEPLLHMLDTLPKESATLWKKALCALSLPLMRNN